MLISDKYEFIIATPVKTGTTSLQSLAMSWLRRDGDPHVLRLMSGHGGETTKHRMCPPHGLEHYTRYMTVRNPFTRVPSMYEWMRKWPHPSVLHNTIHDAESTGDRVSGWVAFVNRLESLRSADSYREGGQRRQGANQPFMWTDTQIEHLCYLMGMDADGSTLPWFRESDVVTLSTEDLSNEWQMLLRMHGVEERDLASLEMPHANRSKSRLFDTADEYWRQIDMRSSQVFMSALHSDAHWFGYAEGGK